MEQHGATACAAAAQVIDGHQQCSEGCAGDQQAEPRVRCRPCQTSSQPCACPAGSAAAKRVPRRGKRPSSADPEQPVQVDLASEQPATVDGGRYGSDQHVAQQVCKPRGGSLQLEPHCSTTWQIVGLAHRRSGPPLCTHTEDRPVCQSLTSTNSEDFWVVAGCSARGHLSAAAQAILLWSRWLSCTLTRELGLLVLMLLGAHC